MKSKKNPPKMLSRRTLCQHHEPFLRDLRKRKPETRGTYERALREFFRWLEKEGKLEEHLVTVARMAEEELLLLVSDQGMRHQEALELVLPKYILISPEEAPPDLPES